MQRSPKAMLLRPTNIDRPECECQLPTMESVGRRSRQIRSRMGTNAAAGGPHDSCESVSHTAQDVSLTIVKYIRAAAGGAHDSRESVSHTAQDVSLTIVKYTRAAAGGAHDSCEGISHTAQDVSLTILKYIRAAAGKSTTRMRASRTLRKT